MSMRGAGTHLIEMAQTRVDGGTPHPDTVITEGATWRWFGAPVRVDGPGAALFLGQCIDRDNLADRAGRVVRKLFRTHGTAVRPKCDGEDDPITDGFIVSDGARFFPVVPIKGRSGDLYQFPGLLPPANTDLVVVKAAPAKAPRPATQGMICFTPDTMISTPRGPTPVQDLQPGDEVLTADAGAREILWTGARHVSGAQMHLDPSLRPIRLRTGALGDAHPHPDLAVSGDHRLVLKGRAAQLLFGTDEVLVRARDMVDDHRVLVDHAITETVYIHLLLARHEIIWANGVPTETFHPANADLSHLTPAERDLLSEAAGDVTTYGPTARRCLSAAEHAILRFESPPHYLA